MGSDYAKYGHGGVAVESRTNGGVWLLTSQFTQKMVYDDHPLAVPVRLR